MSFIAAGLIGTSLLSPALAQIPSSGGVQNPFSSGGALSGFSNLGTSLLGSVNGLAGGASSLLNSPNLLLLGGAAVLLFVILK